MPEKLAEQNVGKTQMPRAGHSFGLVGHQFTVIDELPSQLRSVHGKVALYSVVLALTTKHSI